MRTASMRPLKPGAPASPPPIRTAGFRAGTTAAIPRENISECERQFLIVDFRGATPEVQVVKVEDKVL